MGELEKQIKIFKEALDKIIKKLTVKNIEYTELISKQTGLELGIQKLESKKEKMKAELYIINNPKEILKKIKIKKFKEFLLYFVICMIISGGAVLLFLPSLINLSAAFIFSMIYAPLWPIATYRIETIKFRKRYKNELEQTISEDNEELIELKKELEIINKEIMVIVNQLNDFETQENSLKSEYERLNYIKEQFLSSQEYQEIVENLFEEFSRKLKK